MTAPIIFRWDGEAMIPLPRFHALCNKQFVVGECMPMVQWQDRSTATHNHEFAWLTEAWQSLPENLKDLYPTTEHLRKRALIDAGYYDEEIIDVGSKAGAMRVAAYARKRDDFAYVAVRGPFVIVRTAKSQSRRAMDRKTFQESKTKIMGVVADLIGVTPEQVAAA